LTSIYPSLLRSQSGVSWSRCSHPPPPDHEANTLPLHHCVILSLIVQQIAAASQHRPSKSKSHLIKSFRDQTTPKGQTYKVHVFTLYIWPCVHSLQVVWSLLKSAGIIWRRSDDDCPRRSDTRPDEGHNNLSANSSFPVRSHKHLFDVSNAGPFGHQHF
jgi:hypothetical protein